LVEVEGGAFPFFKGVGAGEGAAVDCLCGWSAKVGVETVLPEESHFDEDAED